MTLFSNITLVTLLATEIVTRQTCETLAASGLSLKLVNNLEESTQ